MFFANRPLRTLQLGDIRTIVDSGVSEHLQLEYKSDLYKDGHSSRREFLLDIGMFANSQGGVLLIGVPERRDVQGQPTGAPDPSAQLGVTITNPEAILLSYDARVLSCIDERLELESTPIPVEAGRFVLALRIPNSTRKPHRIYFEGHAYYPARRERQRYEMDARELKELTLRMASQSARADRLVEGFVASGALRAPAEDLILRVSFIPVFFSEFMLDLRDQNIVSAFSRVEPRTFSASAYVRYGFGGLERGTSDFNKVTLGRNGLVTVAVSIPSRRVDSGLLVYAQAFDLLLKRILERLQLLYEAAGISGPFVIGLSIDSQLDIVAQSGPYEISGEHISGFRVFPRIQLPDLIEGGMEYVRPICDQFWQSFGLRGSTSFDENGHWKQS